MRKVFVSAWIGLSVVLLAGSLPQQTQAAEAPATQPAGKDQAALEKEFAVLLTNSNMIGSFTMGADGPARKDSYTILKAVKGEGDKWVITAKIEYKGFALPMDITVPVKWAGDTPVISITNQKIIGFGTFTARVMFYGNQYAGTWDGGNHGGLMWGKIEKVTPATQPGK